MTSESPTTISACITVPSGRRFTDFSVAPKAAVAGV